MQAFERGEAVEFRDNTEAHWNDSRVPIWGWGYYDYRIKPKLIEGWVNLYPDGTLSLYERRESADKFANSNRIRCVKVREVPDDE
jgi:hypothetical protein